MNTGAILNDQMTLDEKLAAIDAAMQQAQEEAKEKAKKLNIQFVPVDPSELTQCLGCQ